jgi:hypothetical protein
MYRSSVLVGGEWSASSPGSFTHATQWIGGWVGPRAGLNDMENRKFLTLQRLEHRPLGRPVRNQSLCRLPYLERLIICPRFLSLNPGPQEYDSRMLATTTGIHRTSYESFGALNLHVRNVKAIDKIVMEIMTERKWRGRARTGGKLSNGANAAMGRLANRINLTLRTTASCR